MSAEGSPEGAGTSGEARADQPPYEPNPVHRDRTPDKSQWTIPPADETACFDQSVVRGWLGPTRGWGVHLVAQRPDWLGTARDHVTRVFIPSLLARSEVRGTDTRRMVRATPRTFPKSGCLRSGCVMGSSPQRR